MNDEEMKRLWQTQSIPQPVTDIPTLLAMAGQKHREFQRAILWCDFTEMGIALALIPIFLAFARREDALWTSQLIVLALLFVVGFIVVDRRRRRRKAAARPGETIADTLAAALADVEHQIWLQRNVLWWFIGPLMGALIIGDAHRVLSGELSPAIFISLVVSFLVGIGTWWLNRMSVKRDLEPRRAELQRLLEAVR